MKKENESIPMFILKIFCIMLYYFPAYFMLGLMLYDFCKIPLLPLSFILFIFLSLKAFNRYDVDKLNDDINELKIQTLSLMMLDIQNNIKKQINED